MTATASPRLTSIDAEKRARMEWYPASTFLRMSIFASGRRMDVVAAQVHLNDPRVGHDVLRQPFSYFFAVIENNDPIDRLHQNSHDVLYPDNGDAFFTANAGQQFGRLVHLVFIQPTQALVSQQQSRFGGESLCQFKFLETGSSQLIDEGI